MSEKQHPNLHAVGFMIDITAAFANRLRGRAGQELEKHRAFILRRAMIFANAISDQLDEIYDPHPGERGTATDGFRSSLPLDKQELFDWHYEMTRLPEAAVYIGGICLVLAEANPKITVWEALAEARRRIEATGRT